MQIRHGRIHLTLHTLARREGPTLLLLHALFGASTDWGDVSPLWPGSVYGLDFSGHGDSERLPGGAYYAELMVADADAALAHVGPAKIAGAGFGAYIALLLAGARPKDVAAALLLPGVGLEGGGPAPTYGDLAEPTLPLPNEPPGRHDGRVRVLGLELRPPEYATQFAATVRRLLLVEDGTPRPPWWEAARRSPSAQLEAELDLAGALRKLAAA